MELDDLYSIRNGMENLGLHTPTVPELLEYVRDQKGILTVDLEDPHSWKGYVLARIEPGKNSYLEGVFSLDLSLFPRGERFMEATLQILETIGTAGETHYVEMAAHFGLRLIPSERYAPERSFVITLPHEEIKKETEIYKRLTE